MMSSPRSGRSNINHLHSVPTAKSVYLCLNGDHFTPPKRMILNAPSMDAFLEEVTKKIKAGEYLRDVCTPHHGKKQIKQLSDFENGECYVVKPKRESFRHYDYQNISPQKTPRKGPRMSRNNSSIFTKWFKQNDIANYRSNKYADIKARFNDIDDQGIRIYVHVNGDFKRKAEMVLIKKKRLERMTYIIDDINKSMEEQQSELVWLKWPSQVLKVPVKRSYRTPRHQIQPESFYVAVERGHKDFQPGNYSLSRQDQKNFTVSPFYSSRSRDTAYLWQDPGSNNSRPTTWTSKYSAPVPPIRPSPNQSVASHPETNLRRRKIQNAQHEDVHQKAVKHKRTPEKRTRQVDYDQDDSNVFRAKKENKATRNAKEVQETRDTKTDVPIDQQRAEQVEEELLPPDHYHLTPLEVNRRPSDEDHVYTKEDINGFGQDDRRSPRGHAYTKEKSDKDINPYKVLDPIKKDQRSSTPLNDDTDDEDEKKKEEEAATKIQASFRGHQARQEVAKMQKKDTKSTPPKSPPSKSPPPTNKNQKENTQDSMTAAENEAAAKIQAGFRGYQTRQELKAKGHKVRPVDSQGETGEATKVSKENKEKEDEAATKIQASFRGYQARKDVKKMQDEKKKNEAATLIQANFKGYKVRKELKENKGEKSGAEKGGKDKGGTEKGGAEKGGAEKGGGAEPKAKPNSNEKPKNETMTDDEAATKIQASFRGHQARQELKKKDKGAGIGQGKGETVISTPPHSSEAPGQQRVA
ncbi:doublecortin domain-containing protein 2-like [Argopecten irradians]|uniref:doublecortin domain-containing protein 2-like n=1 Tax=Argopecten irradians TaxID=31199 RepID=UPI00371FEF09